ncbi:hypothetical protein SUNI508_12283 [Seiridium unicorne]|uniref:Fungal N-terminal domain-containing protein n=1 Tax=Seiridium unicorne TaxID=138068 RepID=A0ABR2UE15_9PEZI
MDPVSVLGATAASAQILGYAVRGFLSTAKLFQDVKDAPTKVFQLLRHIDKEVALMDRLLHPGSPVFSQLSVSQYAQISPHAVEARRALQDIQRTLQPIGAVLNVPNDGKGTPRRLTRLWKSVVTVKVMNEMESDLKMVERLNASLVRELHVSGLETQALVRDQSGQILAIASASLTSAAETYQSVQHMEALQTRALGSLDASITNIFEGVEYARQDILEHQLALDRSLTSTRNELAVIREDLNRLVQDRSAAMSNQVQTKLANENITVSSHAQGVDEKLVELVRAQSVADRNPPIPGLSVPKTELQYSKLPFQQEWQVLATMNTRVIVFHPLRFWEDRKGDQAPAGVSASEAGQQQLEITGALVSK